MQTKTLPDTVTWMEALGKRTTKCPGLGKVTAATHAGDGCCGFPCAHRAAADAASTEAATVLPALPGLSLRHRAPRLAQLAHAPPPSFASHLPNPWLATHSGALPGTRQSLLCSHALPTQRWVFLCGLQWALEMSPSLPGLPSGGAQCSQRH